MQKSSLRDSYIVGLEAEVRLCSKLGTWCGMLELAGLATVFGRPVRFVYPTKFRFACHAFMNATFYPRQLMQQELQQEQIPAIIMWSCMTMSAGNSPSPNHFVPLVIPMTVSTETKGKSTTESFAKPRKRLLARNKSSHPVSKKTKQQTLFGFAGLETEQSHVKIPSPEHSISSLDESSHALHDQKLQLLATSPTAITQATTTTTATTTAL